jgi:hypothetical protein
MAWQDDVNSLLSGSGSALPQQPQTQGGLMDFFSGLAQLPQAYGSNLFNQYAQAGQNMAQGAPQGWTMPKPAAIPQGQLGPLPAPQVPPPIQAAPGFRFGASR